MGLAHLVVSTTILESGECESVRVRRTFSFREEAERWASINLRSNEAWWVSRVLMSATARKTSTQGGTMGKRERKAIPGEWHGPPCINPLSDSFSIDITDPEP